MGRERTIPCNEEECYLWECWSSGIQGKGDFILGHGRNLIKLEMKGQEFTWGWDSEGQDREGKGVYTRNRKPELFT